MPCPKTAVENQNSFQVDKVLVELETVIPTSLLESHDFSSPEYKNMLGQVGFKSLALFWDLLESGGGPNDGETKVLRKDKF